MATGNNDLYLRFWSEVNRGTEPNPECAEKQKYQRRNGFHTIREENFAFGMGIMSM